MRTGKIVMLVIGSLLILIGLGLAAGAAVVGTLNAGQGDDRYFSAPAEVYEVDSHALTAPEIEVSGGVGAQDGVGTLQVQGESTTGQELFIGVGPEADVDRYLADVRHSELEEVTFRPFRPYYEERQGTAVPAPPGEQDFWTARASGSGEQSLEWNLEQGDWTAVVMNADGSRPVSAELQIGVRSDLLGPLTWTLLISSIVLLIAGIGLAVAGAIGLNRQRRGGPGRTYDSYASAGGPGGPGQSGPGQPGGPKQAGPGQPGPRHAGPGQPGGPPQTYSQMQDRYGREQEPASYGVRPGGPVGATAAGMARSRGTAPAGGTVPGGPAAGGGGAAGIAVGVRDPGLIGPRYPVRLYGELDPNVSRWMWLVKWFLAIPHYIVLFFLWIAFFVSTVIAGFVILFTGRYPQGLFDFNVGVVRWSWRVTFYATRVLGTDRYPPFTLQRTDYPADFSVDYPRELSRWLVLVKWWLLVIPQALVVSAITQSTLVVNRFWGTGSDAEFWRGEWSGTDPVGMWPGGWDEGWNNNVFTTVSWQGLSLLSLLVLIAVVILLFTGRYPRQLFDLLMGLNRWTYRVLAYAALMRDEYPPFRLDQGPADRRDEAAGLGRPGPG